MKFLTDNDISFDEFVTHKEYEVTHGVDYATQAKIQYVDFQSGSGIYSESFFVTQSIVESLENLFDGIKDQLVGFKRINAFYPCYVMNIAQEIFGDYIEPGTFELNHYSDEESTNQKIVDDSHGNLVLISSESTLISGSDLTQKQVGNIYYNAGFAYWTYNQGNDRHTTILTNADVFPSNIALMSESVDNFGFTDLNNSNEISKNFPLYKNFFNKSSYFQNGAQASLNGSSSYSLSQSEYTAEINFCLDNFLNSVSAYDDISTGSLFQIDLMSYQTPGIHSKIDYQWKVYLKPLRIFHEKEKDIHFEVHLNVKTTSSYQDIYYSNIIIKDNTWNHLAFTKDDSNYTLILNNDILGSESIGSIYEPVNHDEWKFLIGSRTNDTINFFVDQIRVSTKKRWNFSDGCDSYWIQKFPHE